MLPLGRGLCLASACLAPGRRHARASYAGQAELDWGLSWAYFLGHHPVLRVATVQACTTLVTRCGRILGPDHPDAPPRCPALPGGARHANLLGWPRNR